VRPRAVFHFILYELESRDPDRIERQVVGAARVTHRDGRRAQVIERLEPLREDRSYRRIFLRIDTADLPRAIVHVEVRRDLLLLRLQLQRPVSWPQEVRNI